MLVDHPRTISDDNRVLEDDDVKRPLLAGANDTKATKMVLIEEKEVEELHVQSPRKRARGREDRREGEDDEEGLPSPRSETGRRGGRDTVRSLSTSRACSTASSADVSSQKKLRDVKAYFSSSSLSSSPPASPGVLRSPSYSRHPRRSLPSLFTPCLGEGPRCCTCHPNEYTNMSIF
jgi:hypothetical protein